MATKTSRKKRAAGSRRRARRTRRGRNTGGNLRHLREVGGLGLFAAGLFMALVLYLGWSGGIIGEAAEQGLRYLFGLLAVLTPPALFLGGAWLIFPDMPKGPRAFRIGAVLLMVALFLACGANTFSLLGSEPAHTRFFDSEYFYVRGGLAGEALYWLTGSLLGNVGSTVAVFFLLLSAVFLITGASVRAVLVASGSGARRAAASARQTSRLLGQTLTERRAAGGAFTMRGSGAESATSGSGRVPFGVDADEAARRPALRQTVTIADGLEGAPLDGARSYPDLFGEEKPRLELVGDDPGGQAAPGRESPGENYGGPEKQEELFPREGESRQLYMVPGSDMLRKSSEQTEDTSGGEERISRVLVETLASFGIEARVAGTVAGPRVTRYELQLAPGIKVSKVSNLKNDIAYALATTEIRILAPIPGKSAVGVEVPNMRPNLVTLGDIYRDFPQGSGPLMAWLGKDIAGKPVYADLAQMPHLLVAGTTGSGKSGCINCLISSILLRSTPEEVRMILIDPKRVELSHFEGIPHLLTPVVNQPKDAANVLANLVSEMESRYSQMQLVKARQLGELNKVLSRRGQKPLPYILLVVDELADLMMTSPTEVEDAIIRLAQKSRAVGIHLVLATQRPSVDVITGMIKANIPSRIAFAVSSQTDSRVILDTGGAESLLGQGDMLFSPLGSSQLKRVQGAYISEEEIQLLTDRCRHQQKPEFDMELLEGEPGEGREEGGFADQDELLPEAMRLVVEAGTASVSILQRRLRVGYTRAGRLIDMLERRGVISGYEGSKPRRVLIGESDLQRLLAEAESGASGGVPDEMVAAPQPAGESGVPGNWEE
ncbi:MAG: DNA translocase FtsK [Thermoleophilia bacterium]|nr:DNA translocase FtsK [Thermoleophilia bacterium]